MQPGAKKNIHNPTSTDNSHAEHQEIQRNPAPTANGAVLHRRAAPVAALSCRVGLWRNGGRAPCIHRHPLCRPPFPLFDIPAGLPETHTLPHRKRATDSRAWRVPTQHRVHRAVPCRGFPRAPDPVAADFRIKDRHRPVDGQKHAQTGTDRLAQTDSHRGHHQGTGRV